MSYENPWLYDGIPYENPDEKYYGFVYEITNTNNNRKYIGKKFFWSTRTKVVTVNKKKKKKRVKLESDWKSYYGSNKELLTDVEQYGTISFNRKIIKLCVSKSECAYWELDEQIRNEVLLREDYYNSWIMVKVRKDHLRGIGIEAVP